MRGKAWFVIGAALGYVVGTRVGRRGYEKLKQQAAGLWGSAPVQKGVGAVQDRARDIPVVGNTIAQVMGSVNTHLDDASDDVQISTPTA
ncbi:MAG: hypothetical protein M3N46_14045 [Actinomycetota bacterium]|nr:hypothetical protein [Actinomycetota bacterium]